MGDQAMFAEMVSDQMLVYLMSALITAGIQVGGFAVAWILKTETFYDVLGGVNYLALVAYSFTVESSAFGDARKLASTALFIASRSWLLGFLAWRTNEEATVDSMKFLAKLASPRIPCSSSSSGW